MADLADIAQRQQELAEEKRAKDPYVLPPGTKGICRLCSEESARLINGVCAPCRDKHGLA